MKNIKEYKSAGAWFKDARREGIPVSREILRGITTAMKELNLTFPEVLEQFIKEEIITWYIGKDGELKGLYNMQGHKALGKKVKYPVTGCNIGRSETIWKYPNNANKNSVK